MGHRQDREGVVTVDSVTEKGLMRRIERNTLYGKSPEGWHYPLINVVSSRLNRYGNNPEWQERLGPITHVYADGGLTGVNARDGVAGTWGICALQALKHGWNDRHKEKGLCFPANFGLNMGHVTNNQSEFWAVCMALSMVPDGWSGVLVLDSEVTASRITNPHRHFTAVRWDDRLALKTLLLDRVNCTLKVIAGHGKDLEDRDIYGNVTCDKLANEAKKEYFGKIDRGEWVDVIAKERERRANRPVLAPG